MEVDLTQDPDQKRFVIQPEVFYSGPGIRSHANAPHSDGMVLVIGLGA